MAPNTPPEIVGKRADDLRPFEGTWIAEFSITGIVQLQISSMDSMRAAISGIVRGNGDITISTIGVWNGVSHAIYAFLETKPADDFFSSPPEGKEISIRLANKSGLALSVSIVDCGFAGFVSVQRVNFSK